MSIAMAADLVDISVSRIWTGVDPIESTIDEYTAYNIRRQERYDREDQYYRTQMRILGIALLTCVALLIINI
jgi:hypothetical protein